MFTKRKHGVQPMSVEAASDYARELVKMESRGPGDTGNAMDRLQTRYGIGVWQISHLRANRAKSCDTKLYTKIRLAYLDMCARQVSKFQHKIEMERAAGDDTNSDLAAEAAALAAKIYAKRAAINQGREMK